MAEGEVKYLTQFILGANCFAEGLFDEDGTLLAVAAFSLTRGTRPIVYLRLVAVSLPAQDEGLGKSLVFTLLERWETQFRGGRVVWMAHEDNERSRSISESFGAVVVEVPELDIDPGYVAYELDL